MDFYGVVVFAGILLCGAGLGLLLSVLAPSDEEAAETHRQLLRRALARLPARVRPDRAGVRTAPEEGFRG